MLDGFHLLGRISPSRNAWLVLSLLLVAAYGQAQSRLSGEVKDNTGAVIPGATAVVINEATGVQRSYTTDSYGRFAASLPEATYTIRVEKAGFRPAVLKDVRLAAGESREVSIIIPIGEGGGVVER